jgi:hypothetical protein
MEHYDISDMVFKFGYRIKNALYFNEKGEISGLYHEKLIKIMKYSHNKDMWDALKCYQGIILAPFIIQSSTDVITTNFTTKNILLKHRYGKSI